MSIFDIEEQPITPINITELGFLVSCFSRSYVNTYKLKEENISISYRVALKPLGDSWVATLSIMHFNSTSFCTWGGAIPPLEINVKTLNDLIILTSGECVKQHCKEFITNDKILW